MPSTSLSKYSGIYNGSPIYIVAPGPSLWGWSRETFTKGCPTLFLNSAGEFIRNYVEREIALTAHRIIIDSTAITGHLNREYHKYKVTPVNLHTFASFHMMGSVTSEDLKALNTLNFTMFYTEENFVCPLKDLKSNYLWRNTLFSAMSLAWLMGAKEIRLVGVDYGMAGGSMPYWDGGGNDLNAKSIVARNGILHRDKMNSAVTFLGMQGVDVRRFKSPDEEVNPCERY